MVAYHTCTVMEGFEFHMCPQKLESSSDGRASKNRNVSQCTEVGCGVRVTPFHQNKRVW